LPLSDVDPWNILNALDGVQIARGLRTVSYLIMTKFIAWVPRASELHIVRVAT